MNKPFCLNFVFGTFFILLLADAFVIVASATVGVCALFMGIFPVKMMIAFIAATIGMLALTFGLHRYAITVDPKGKSNEHRIIAPFVAIMRFLSERIK